MEAGEAKELYKLGDNQKWREALFFAAGVVIGAGV